MIFSRWPINTKKHATELEKATLPLHTKNIKPFTLKFFRNFVATTDPTHIDQFDHFALPLTHPDKFGHTTTKFTEGCNELTTEDETILLQNGRIEAAMESSRQINVFSVAETKKMRRRFISHPAQENQYWRALQQSSEMNIHMTTWLAHQLKWKMGVTIDITTYYQLFEIPIQARRYYTFPSITNDTLLQLVTIPTGAAYPPGLAQTVSNAIARQIRQVIGEQIPIDIDVYLDNFRILANSPTDAKLAIEALRHHTLDWIPWNENLDIILEELATGCLQKYTSYDFLGTTYDHRQRTAGITEKTIGKLHTIKEKIFNGELLRASLREVLSACGVLVHASTILALPRHELYYLYKFLKHRTGGELDRPAHLWPCLLDPIATRVERCITKPKRCVDLRPFGTLPILFIFTDASDDGWGFWIFDNELVYQIGGVWWGSLRAVHISIKEMLVPLFATEFAHTHSRRGGRGLDVTFFVDNTTVVRAHENQRSSAFRLNALVAAFAKCTAAKNWRTKFLWIPSAKNLSDKNSRAGTHSAVLEIPEDAKIEEWLGHIYETDEASNTELWNNISRIEELIGNCCE